jgi:hypothetical protein
MFVIKQFNTLPSLEATLLDPSGQPVDLTGAIVSFSMRSLDSEQRVITGSALIIEPLAGRVVYQWDAANTIQAGAYIGEFDVTFSNGGKETFPNSDYIKINIVRSANTTA